MDTVFHTTCIIFLVIAAFHLCVMVKWDLQMFQQNSYFSSRYWNWFHSSEEHLTVKRIITLVVLLALFAPFVRALWYCIAFLALVLAFQAYSGLTKKYKLPLKFTKRIKRHYIAQLMLMAVIALAVGLLFGVYAAAIAVVAMTLVSPLFTIGTSWLLRPVEKHITQGFIDRAANTLKSMPQLKVIGITGSYGKTSTKNYLNRILSEQFSVCVTPGNFNTTLGVVRTINEHLQPYNEVFICEMGAKNIGDIKEICDLVHPSMGIITAVGAMHLDTFKSIENVQRTKFELADAVPADGLVVVNNDFEYIANREVSNTNVLRYSVNDGKDIDFHAEDVRYSNHGTTFCIVGDGQRIELTTKLVGESNINNLIAAVAVALKLGVPTDKIRYAVSRIEQVEHRLSMKRTAAGITIIDDAYNSNPTGSRMALDVLSQMTGGQRIVITPGMIELGDKQEEYNRALGEHIAETCDIAIVVGQYNRDAIVSGIKAKGFPEDKLHAVDTFNEAQQLMLTLAHAGDTVLYENDLPDTYK